jgi:dihydroflavonol-4-reductase
MTKVIVTGAAGFLGSHIVRSYLERGATVLGVVHNSGNPFVSDALKPRLKLIKLDVRGPVGDFDVFAGYDIVIHTAAKVSADSPEERATQESVNVGGTKNIIEACLRNGIPRLLHISTTAAIGISPDPNRPADETFQFNLEQLRLGYNSTKHRAEQLVLESNCPLLETIVVNPGFIFGLDNDVYRGAQIIEPALRKRRIVCTNGGLSIVHIDDVVDGIRRAGTDGRAGERYILSGDNLSFSKIARTVGFHVGTPAKILAIPNLVRDLFGASLWLLAPLRVSAPPLYLTRHYAYQYYSSEKARRELDFSPRPFEDIIVDYMRRG